MVANRTLTVSEKGTLLPFLLTALSNMGRNKVKSLLTHGQVMVNDQVVTRHDHPLVQGQTVTILAMRKVSSDDLDGVQILFEDDDVLVIDKPAGLLSMGTDTEKEHTAYRILGDYMRMKNPKSRIFIVHRLDRDTSGVMMFAKRESVQQKLQNAWKDVVVERAYLAVVEGRVQQDTGTITSWLKESKTLIMYISRKEGDGQKAITHYEVLHRTGEYSLLKVQLETGRKNQIRVQMQSIGHPVVGDDRYGAIKDPLGRLGLHASVLSFHHPTTDKVMRFETDFPSAFLRVFSYDQKASVTIKS